MSIRQALLVPFLAALAVVLSQPADAANAGFAVVQAPDPQGGSITVGIWYPTDAATRTMPLGLADQTVAPGAPLKGQGLPLIVMSHGNGGFFGSHADTAQALAEAGFVVAALTHTGDNYQDQSRATDMANRPRQLSLVIDYMLGAWPMRAAIDPERVGAFGFSSGGFTVLAAAGGKADLRKLGAHCISHPDFYDCKISAGTLRPVGPAGRADDRWVSDARIKVVVSAAPAIGHTFDKAGLASVTQPLQLWRAGEDEILPHPLYAEHVHQALPRAHEYEVVTGAGHFDFLSPCNATGQVQAAAICSSRPGFDRATFHRAFNSRVTIFFTRHLVAPHG